MDLYNFDFVTLSYNYPDNFLITYRSFRDSLQSLSPHLSHRKVKLLVIDSSYDNVISSLVDGDPLVEYVHIQPSGVYSAMNFALRHTLSDYLMFINSGDLVLDVSTILRSIDLSIVVKPEFDALFFNIHISSRPGYGFLRYPSNLLPLFYQYLFSTLNPHHQSIVFSTSWHKQRYYDLSSGLSADASICLAAAKNAVFFPKLSPTEFIANGLTSGRLPFVSYKKHLHLGKPLLSVMYLSKFLFARIPGFFLFRRFSLTLKVFLFIIVSIVKRDRLKDLLVIS